MAPRVGRRRTLSAMPELPGLQEDPVVVLRREGEPVPDYDDELLAEILLFGDLVALAGASSGFLPRTLVDTTLGLKEPVDTAVTDAGPPSSESESESESDEPSTAGSP